MCSPARQAPGSSSKARRFLTKCCPVISTHPISRLLSSSAFFTQLLHQVGSDGEQADVRSLRFAAEHVEGLVGVDAMKGHEHALGLFDGCAGLKRPLNGIGDVTC